jgi:hypothetical protein
VYMDHSTNRNYSFSLVDRDLQKHNKIQKVPCVTAGFLTFWRIQSLLDIINKHTSHTLCAC